MEPSPGCDSSATTTVPATGFFVAASSTRPEIVPVFSAFELSLACAFRDDQLSTATSAATGISELRNNRYIRGSSSGVVLNGSDAADSRDVGQKKHRIVSLCSSLFSFRRRGDVVLVPPAVAHDTHVAIGQVGRRGD